MIQLIDENLLDAHKNLFSDEFAHPARLTVWCAISSKGIFGPIFATQNINKQWYKNMLENEFVPKIRDSNRLYDFHFMQDEATPDRTRVLHYLS
ncbi:histone-lysine N-methyltransferase SETMAR-like protein [Leptotrombidium deliense]|uniref:Histone-lysine N-methyltransferase SETMAR-like protein n=1 Tax=Leptotrombidium deliense TaxID=299467 RepID=A0A443RX04_9ACAR|nr:histone-lysine N-methyltransferase SETMAR-like protein [Leptotrombidium deliense]